MSLIGPAISGEFLSTPVDGTQVPLPSLGTSLDAHFTLNSFMLHNPGVRLEGTMREEGTNARCSNADVQ